jgi:hypothetical protein
MTDYDWLQENIKRPPTIDEVYSFSERVGIMVVDGKMDEESARRLAFKGFEK